MMTPQEAIDYIEDQGWSKTRLGLDRTLELLRRLGNPQKHLNVIHVAGSNGKGSVCAMLDAILRARSLRTGLYTSPHVEDFRERIQYWGFPIRDENLTVLTQVLRMNAEEMLDHPSQFELTTALALTYFHAMDVDVAIVEVGMGGALDSTNVIEHPRLAVITNVGLEHTEYLGDTLEAIAETKAGIIKPGCACVCYDGAPEVTAVIRRVCEEKNVPLFVADFSRLTPLTSDLRGQTFRWDDTEYRLNLVGPHQLRNAALALTAVETLNRMGWGISEKAVAKGLDTVRWPARMELLHDAPPVFLDGGHNPQCAAALADSLDALLPGQKPVFLTGVLADKDYAGIYDRLLPYASAFVTVTPNSPRALPAEELAAYLRSRGAEAKACELLPTAISAALDLAASHAPADATPAPAQPAMTPVVIFGSLYLAGDVRRQLRSDLRSWLRRRGVAIRDALTPAERWERSVRAAEHIAESEDFQKAKTVMLYRAVRGELNLYPLETLPASQGKRFVYPRVGRDNRMTAWVPDGWVPGAYGIPEPDPATSQRVRPEDIDLVLCPCTAFDAAGNRLGMGGGYYDRFLSYCVRARIYAAAYAAQQISSVPTAPWDEPMDGIFTDSGFLAPLTAKPKEPKEPQ